MATQREASVSSLNAYTIIVKAYSNVGDAKRAVHWLKEMVSRGCQPSRALCEEIERVCRANDCTNLFGNMLHVQAADF